MNLPQGCLNTIMQVDKDNIYMKDKTFSKSLETRNTDDQRLRTVSTFLDNTYMNRAFMYFDDRKNEGQLIVHDDQTVYGFKAFNKLGGPRHLEHSRPGSD